MTANVIGWDVGGVNTKAARAVGWSIAASRIQPYEIQRDPGALPGVLTALAAAIGAQPTDRHALTLTAELSQAFRTKREGVCAVLDAMERAFPGAAVQVYTTSGAFVSPDAARGDPVAVAAANWAATAAIVARRTPAALLIDIGSTTTDIIPIVKGAVAAKGRTDPERLRSGELLYLGALRTPVEAIVHSVPLEGGSAGVSAEGFAIAGDVHLWRETLDPAAYTVPTPDGRPATREFAFERLARVVCADRDMLDARAVTRIADAIAEAQVIRTMDMIDRVRFRFPEIKVAVVAGVGSFIASEAAVRAGLSVKSLSEVMGNALDAAAALAGPAAAVALLGTDA
jgi:probable H4MPT-linked C1 transfer pathway protein